MTLTRNEHRPNTESITSEAEVRLALKLNRELLSATSRGYVTIPIAVILAIITVIDHSARGMRHGCDHTLAREAHASHVLAASRRARNLLRDKRVRHSRPRSRKAIRVKSFAERSTIRTGRFSLLGSRRRAEIDAVQARLRQIETVTVRKTSSGSIDLCRCATVVSAYLCHTDTGLVFFPSALRQRLILPPLGYRRTIFLCTLLTFFIPLCHFLHLHNITSARTQVEILKYLRDHTFGLPYFSGYAQDTE